MLKMTYKMKRKYFNEIPNGDEYKIRWPKLLLIQRLSEWTRARELLYKKNKEKKSEWNWMNMLKKVTW